MSTRQSIRAVVLGLAAIALSVGGMSRAEAGPIVDQQNTTATGYLGPSSSPGQSFTPTLNGIDFATFSLATSSGAGSLVFADLIQGDGFGGTILSVSANVQLVTNTSSFQTYEFDFSPTVSLIPGNVYTLQLIDATGQSLFELEGSGNPYPGGVEYDSAGVAQTGYDLVFSEGIFQTAPPTPAAVPEPTSLALLTVGGLGLAGWRRWRKKRE